MAMDMIEHEDPAGTPGALAARAEADIFQFGTGTNILNRSFLIKKMEIEFQLLSPIVSDISQVSTFAGYLIFQKESGSTDGDTVAEAFDAGLEDDEIHRRIIWSRQFNWSPNWVDVSGNDLADMGQDISWKTSKSFTKGMPLDKLEDYRWKTFNSSPSVAWLTGSITSLRVRYFGVYL